MADDDFSGLEPTEVGGFRPLAESTLVLCRHCGKPIAPARTLMREGWKHVDGYWHCTGGMETDAEPVGGAGRPMPAHSPSRAVPMRGWAITKEGVDVAVVSVIDGKVSVETLVSWLTPADARGLADLLHVAAAVVEDREPLCSK